MSASASTSPPATNVSFTQPTQPATQPSQSTSTSTQPLPATTTTAPPPQPPLPPAHLFDILPSLHALLSRLEPSLNTYTAPTSSALDPSSSSTSTTTTTNPTTFPSSSSSTTTTAHQDLAYKDAVTAAQYLKARMRKAMAELGKLGDMERTVQEQEEEIRALERRIEGQRGVLGRLGDVAAGMGREFGG